MGAGAPPPRGEGHTIPCSCKLARARASACGGAGWNFLETAPICGGAFDLGGTPYTAHQPAVSHSRSTAPIRSMPLVRMRCTLCRRRGIRSALVHLLWPSPQGPGSQALLLVQAYLGFVMPLPIGDERDRARLCRIRPMRRPWPTAHAEYARRCPAAIRRGGEALFVLGNVAESVRFVPCLRWPNHRRVVGVISQAVCGARIGIAEVVSYDTRVASRRLHERDDVEQRVHVVVGAIDDCEITARGRIRSEEGGHGLAAVALYEDQARAVALLEPALRLAPPRVQLRVHLCPQMGSRTNYL